MCNDPHCDHDRWEDRCESCKQDPCECCLICAAPPNEACEPSCGLSDEVAGMSPDGHLGAVEKQ